MSDDTESQQAFESLLQLLKTTRGFDFTAYKRASLLRRVEKRMQLVGVSDFGAYADYLEVRPDEFTALFNMILINVTCFFRDPPVWDYLAKEILPSIINGKGPDAPIRMWSAGCSTGAEAYTLAMILAEALGTEAVRDRVKIYATDADEEALNQARQAHYRIKELENVRPDLMQRYFEPMGDGYCFNKDLRRSVIFGRHDIIQDAPISKVDLLVCRNTLMYLNAETQSRILARFHFALHNDGYLFLGKAETLLTHGKTFCPTDLKNRIFTKVARADMRDQLLRMAPPQERNGHGAVQEQLREAAAEAGTNAQTIIDNNGCLLFANLLARSLFGLTALDIGRPLQDLVLSYRPVELRSLMEQAHQERRPLRLTEVDWPTASGEVRCLDVQVVPLYDTAGTSLGTSIDFTDVTLHRKLQVEYQHATQELEATLEELQSTNEELETTNEELQSTVEELETTNEELQSTNEELETMNEELQSTNEELQTINDELHTRGGEVQATKSLLESILASMQGGVVVLDLELHILVWNRQSEELWGLRSDEVVGKNFLNLEIGLPVEQLKQPIRSCIGQETKLQGVTIEATNRRGRKFQCQIAISPLLAAGPAPEIRGAIVVAGDDQSQA